MLTINQALFIDSNSIAQKLDNMVWLGEMLRDWRHLSSRMYDSLKTIDNKDEQMCLKGHFNPNRSVLDINKVCHSTLKNRGIVYVFKIIYVALFRESSLE